jgi:hypothetical protein
MLLRNCFKRLVLDPMAGEFNGGGSPAEADIAPVNGGPDRDFESLSNGTVEDASPSTPDTSANPAAVTAPIVPADPNNRTAPVATPAQSDWQSIRDAAAAIGYQAPAGITDDRALLLHLVKQAAASQQADVYSQLGRTLAPQADAIQGYLAQQRQQQAAPARQPWEAPEFDQRWAGLVEQDPGTGMFYGKPGTPPEIVGKVNAYVEWKSNFDRNPSAVMNQMVESKAREIAQSTFREQFEAQSRQADVQRIVTENSPWLYQQDQQGRPVVGYNNLYVPTPVGARYMHHVKEVQAMGVTNPRHLDTLAKDRVRAEIAVQQFQTQQASAAQAADPLTQQAVAAPIVNPLQAATPEQRRMNPAATETSQTGLSLQEMIREAMKANGVSDADFANIGR